MCLPHRRGCAHLHTHTGLSPEELHIHGMQFHVDLKGRTVPVGRVYTVCKACVWNLVVLGLSSWIFLPFSFHLWHKGDTRLTLGRQAALTNIFISLMSFALPAVSFISSGPPPLLLPPVRSGSAAPYWNCKGNRRKFLLLEFSADSANCQLFLWTKNSCCANMTAHCFH